MQHSVEIAELDICSQIETLRSVNDPSSELSELNAT